MLSGECEKIQRQTIQPNFTAMKKIYLSPQLFQNVAGVECIRISHILSDPLEVGEAVLVVSGPPCYLSPNSLILRRYVTAIEDVHMITCDDLVCSLVLSALNDAII